jgi:hypothetical protein
MSDEIIEDLDIEFLEGKISKNIVFNDDTISGYLAGCFLASGCDYGTFHGIHDCWLRQ